MNLPFGLPTIKDTVTRKKDESSDMTAFFEIKLAEYRDALEKYRKCILEYSGKLDNYDKRYLDNQLSMVQSAIDITYLKEQTDRTAEQLSELKEGPINQVLSTLQNLVSAILDTNYKLEGLDKNVVNRLSELLLELQKQTMNQSRQLQLELTREIEQLNKKLRKNNTLLGLLIVFSILGLSGLAFIILYVMEIIPF